MSNPFHKTVGEKMRDSLKRQMKQGSMNPHMISLIQQSEIEENILIPESKQNKDLSSEELEFDGLSEEEAEAVVRSTFDPEEFTEAFWKGMKDAFTTDESPEES